MHFYPILILALLGLMLLYYALFYWMARGLARNMRLAQENRLLQIQSAQYRILQKNISDTRRARHDLRQHFKALQGCVESGDLSRVAEYVKAYGESLPPDTVRPFCKNYAVDAVLHHYAEPVSYTHLVGGFFGTTVHTTATFGTVAGNLAAVHFNFSVLSQKYASA